MKVWVWSCKFASPDDYIMMLIQDEDDKWYGITFGGVPADPRKVETEVLTVDLAEFWLRVA